MSDIKKSRDKIKEVLYLFFFGGYLPRPNYVVCYTVKIVIHAKFIDLQVHFYGSSTFTTLESQRYS